MTLFVVFDLDGTLALNEHRVHHIRGASRNYDAFYAACADDVPCRPAIAALRAHLTVGHRVEIWSSRSSVVYAVTDAWLERCGVPPELLTRLRAAGDDRPSVDVKRGWLREARADGGAPDLVYEDRDKLVAMWREEGVTCFQVAPGPL